MDLFKNKNEYKTKKLFITRALEYYIKNNDVDDLIKHSSLKTIKESYKKYFQEKMSLDEEYSSENEELLEVDNDKIIYNNNNILDLYDEKSIGSSSKEENNKNNIINVDETNSDGDGNINKKNEIKKMLF